MSAAIYTRVSTLDQAREGYSLEAQRKVRLTAASLQMIEKAVLVYACSANADKALAERMAQALGDRVVKKTFF